jgi:hypothetical protein
MPCPAIRGDGELCGRHRRVAVGRPGRGLDSDRGCGFRRQPSVVVAADRLAGWNLEQVAGPGTNRSFPSVAQVGDATVIAVMGLYNTLALYWQPIGSQGWNPEQVAGLGPAFSAPSVAQVGDSTVIAAQGLGDSLALYWQPIGSQQWNPEEVTGSGL